MVNTMPALRSLPAGWAEAVASRKREAVKQAANLPAFVSMLIDTAKDLGFGNLIAIRSLELGALLGFGIWNLGFSSTIGRRAAASLYRIGSGSDNSANLLRAGQLPLSKGWP
jgi:hypothetical protein